ncbi:hypothetical protein DFP94_11479 [Fontibacillus phaseoli]|uniref:Uncharacterized protein n=1 Tax=Fontibacillus phaseoli TaxID=1416533 RepID=A0A369B2I1_9BACL|nr:hypothetical protein [Fontibacillus phaseoli]RCX15631.1 hypothetical protein DFP94_11479 [Fontibacillus phaseoli]
MDFITPNHTLIFSSIIIAFLVFYKWFEKKLLQAMYQEPQAYSSINKSYRLQFQKIYRDKSDHRHSIFFDDELTKARLNKISSPLNKME